MIAGDPNVELLTRIAEALGDLRERFVFVGGCATALLITDPAAPPVRATHDVDAIVAIISLPEYLRLGKALRDRGFVQTLDTGEPPYRWAYAGMQFDVLPVGEMVLGFTNRWYEAAMQDAAVVQLAAGLAIRLVSAARFYRHQARSLRGSRPGRLSGKSRSGGCAFSGGWTSGTCC